MTIVITGASRGIGKELINFFLEKNLQVIAVTLLPAALVFLILLLNDTKTMGEYKNNLFQNIVGTSIIVVIIVLSTLYGISTVFPTMFR